MQLQGKVLAKACFEADTGVAPSAAEWRQIEEASMARGGGGEAYLGSRVRLAGVAQPGFDGKQGFLSGYQDMSGFYQVTLGAILFTYLLPFSPVSSLRYSCVVSICSI